MPSIVGTLLLSLFYKKYKYLFGKVQVSITLPPPRASSYPPPYKSFIIIFTHFYLHPCACVPHLLSNLLHIEKLFIAPTGSTYSRPYFDHYMFLTQHFGWNSMNYASGSKCFPFMQRNDHFP
jgi:hypothetical protein